MTADRTQDDANKSAVKVKYDLVDFNVTQLNISPKAQCPKCGSGEDELELIRKPSGSPDLFSCNNCGWAADRWSMILLLEYKDKEHSPYLATVISKDENENKTEKATQETTSGLVVGESLEGMKPKDYLPDEQFVGDKALVDAKGEATFMNRIAEKLKAPAGEKPKQGKKVGRK